MEAQIKRCLISLRKIAAVTDQWHIDTSAGEIEQHIDGLYNNAVRTVKGYVKDHRAEMIRVLNAKYADCKELVKAVIESNQFLIQLPVIRRVLILSKKGLYKLQSNIYYSEDAKVKIPLDHLVEDEVPSVIKLIEAYIFKHKDRFPADALVDDNKKEDDLLMADIVAYEKEKEEKFITSNPIPIPTPTSSPAKHTSSPSIYGTPNDFLTGEKKANAEETDDEDEMP
jgi:hypothetical protein